jgi:OFA family oxalate/formate antiporter-like MFS transporter
MPRFKRPKIFYGWWIVGNGFILQLLVSSLFFNSTGAYASALHESFGWSNTSLNLGFSLNRVESGALGPLQGWAIDKFGPAIMIRIGAILLGGGLILFSQIDTLWQFYVTYSLLAVGAGLAGFMTLTVAVVNWFQRLRARAIGFMQTGFAVGGIFSFLVVIAIDNIGWRTTVLIAGIVVIIIGQLVAGFIYHRPEDRGDTVDGDPTLHIQGIDTNNKTFTSSIDDSGDFTTREALRTPSFWFLSLGHAASVLIVGTVIANLYLHARDDLGYSFWEVGVISFIISVSQVFGLIGGGYVGDKVNKRGLLVVCMLAHVLGLFLLAFAGERSLISFIILLAFAIIHGLAWGVRPAITQAMRADYFGRTHFGKIMGFSSMIIMIGMTLGPLIAGLVSDWQGDYRLAFSIIAGVALLGSVFFWLAKPPTKPGISEKANA